MSKTPARRLSDWLRAEVSHARDAALTVRGLIHTPATPAQDGVEIADLLDSLRVEFSPVCSAADGKIVGYAAWGEAQWAGDPTPISDIADGTVTELMLDALTQAVLGRSCRWLRHKLGNSGLICLPMRRAQLLTPHAVTLILVALQRNSIQPYQLWIDLDETEFSIDGHDPALDGVIDALRAKRVRFVLSDFGRETAPVDALTSPRLDAIKLHSGWLDTREPVGHVARSLIASARRQALAVVGNCADEPSRATAATELGCTHLQHWNSDRLTAISDRRRSRLVDLAAVRAAKLTAE